MSTQINITVDTGGLSARAKQQQEAARLAQLERERTRRVEAEAKAQRDAKQTAEGRRPDGQPQFGAPPPKPRPQDEPAAFRANTFDYGQGYFTVSRSTNDAAVITVRSGDKSAFLTATLAGSEIPEGYRSRSGADKLPELAEPPAGAAVLISDPYRKRYLAVSDLVLDAFGNLYTYTQTIYEKAHVGVSVSSTGAVSQSGAYLAGTGGWASFHSEVLPQLTILPVDSSTAIFAYTETRLSYKTYFYEDSSFVQYRAAATSGLPDCTSGPVQYSCVPGSTQSVSGSAKFAVLVGKDFVKQVPYPSQLDSALSDSKLFTPGTYVAELRTGTKNIVSCTTDLTPVTFSGDFFSYQSDPVPANLFATQLLMASWGDAQGPGWSRTSPGIYDALKSDITPVNSPSPVSYAEIKAKLASAAQSFKWFRVIGASNPKELQRYYGQLPEFYGDAFSESAFRRTRTFSYDPQSDETYYRWNSWDRPNYCRQQALALGFSAADLTP